jgi:hypothetical protein
MDDFFSTAFLSLREKRNYFSFIDMSSLQTRFAQPLTRRFVQQADNGGQDLNGYSIFYVMVDAQPTAAIYSRIRFLYGGDNNYGTVWVSRAY